MSSLALSLSSPQENGGKKALSLLVISNNYVSPIEGKALMDMFPRFATKKNGDCSRLSEDSLERTSPICVLPTQRADAYSHSSCDAEYVFRI